ncbi:MAG: Uncharacterised protein [Hyphomonas sp. TMED17]|nr:MAG: Uncharacterised protein [Hyphomonas sp. TMED17]
MQLRKRHQLWQSRHRTIIIHNFTDHTRRVQTRHARNIDRRFSMPGPHQCSAIPRDKWKHMPGRNDVIRVERRIDSDIYRMRPIMRRNTRRDAVFCFDRHGKSRPHTFAIFPRHHMEVQGPGTLRRHRQTNQTTPETGHKIHHFRRRETCRNNQVAFILTVFSIDQNEHSSIPGIFNDFVDAGYRIRKIFCHADLPIIGFYPGHLPQSFARRSALTYRFLD